MTDKLRKEARKHLDVKGIHGESKRDNVKSCNCSDDISHNETSLLEETHQTKIHEWRSSTVPNTESCHQNVSKCKCIFEEKSPGEQEYLKYRTEELTIVCEVCNATLEDKFHVGQHMSYHESSFKPLAATPYTNQTKRMLCMNNIEVMVIHVMV